MSDTGTAAPPRRMARAPGTSALLSAAAALLAAATLTGSSAVASQAQSFDPITFFTGATESSGSLKQALSSAKATRVTGFGAMQAGGTFVLDQTMTVAGEKPTSRQWLLHQIAPGHFGGTISDAKGPVTIDVTGNRLLIRYTMNNGLKVESVLTIEQGGRTGRNLSTVRKWGMSVATLDETISKR